MALEQLDATIAAFGDVGVISELDIDVLPSTIAQGNADITTEAKADASLNPYVSALPDSVQEELANRYAKLFGLFLKHRDVMTRVTLWGVTDGDSWKNDWPVRGRTNYPLLFNRNGQPKPAFDAVVRVSTGQSLK